MFTVGGHATLVSCKSAMSRLPAKSAARAIGSQVGREIVRGVLGSILGTKRRR